MSKAADPKSKTMYMKFGALSLSCPPLKEFVLLGDAAGVLPVDTPTVLLVGPNPDRITAPRPFETLLLPPTPGWTVSVGRVNMLMDVRPVDVSEPVALGEVIFDPSVED